MQGTLLLLVSGLGWAADPNALEVAVEAVRERVGAEAVDGALYRAALDGMAEHLDLVLGADGNRVLSQEDLDREAAWARGDRTGIGVEYSILGGQGLLVTEVFAGGPADRAGLRVGDLVVGLDGQGLTGLNAVLIQALVQKGGEGPVQLDVRGERGGVRQVSVVRGPFQVPPVRLLRAEGPLEIRVEALGPGAADALAALLARPAQGCVLDLRDTAVGDIDEAGRIAGLFLGAGALVVERQTRAGETTQLISSGERRWAGEIVVLVNRGTSGPAEVLAAALQAQGRATLVGTRTAGRATEGTIVPLGNGMFLDIHDTALRDPMGRSWADQGVGPDVTVEPVDLAVPRSAKQAPPDLQRDAALRLAGESGR